MRYATNKLSELIAYSEMTLQVVVVQVKDDVTLKNNRHIVEKYKIKWYLMNNN